jgi:hypothetical protein
MERDDRGIQRWVRQFLGPFDQAELQDPGSVPAFRARLAHHRDRMRDPEGECRCGIEVPQGQHSPDCPLYRTRMVCEICGQAISRYARDYVLLGGSMSTVAHRDCIEPDDPAADPPR